MYCLAQWYALSQYIMSSVQIVLIPALHSRWTYEFYISMFDLSLIDSPEMKSADARSIASKTSISVKIPSGQTSDDKKKIESPRRKTPTKQVANTICKLSKKIQEDSSVYHFR